MHPARLDLRDAVRSALAAHADPARAEGQQRYMKSSMPYYGLISPVLRGVLRPVLDDPAHRMRSRPEWEATVRLMWDGATYREERYAALALARHRSYGVWRDAGLVELIRHLVVTGAWWDLVDEIASHLLAPVLRQHRLAVTPIVRRWAVEDDLWLRRAAILSQLGARDQTGVALLTEVIEANLEQRLSGTPLAREFFIRKAIGWALREYARTDPDWVRTFVTEHADGLSGLSRREALKHLKPV